MSNAQRQRVEKSLRSSGNAAEYSHPIDFECERRDGSHFLASCVVTPLRTGGMDHWLAVLNDVTERKQLEREIIEIANREQQRIGGDLHDGLGQELTGIALMLRSIVAQIDVDRAALSRDLEEVIDLVNNAIESTRALARGLSPVSAGHGGLTVAIEALAARTRERYGIQVTFIDELNGASLRLDENTATHLYRIAQEALTNVVRHSLASQVVVRLGVEGAGLQLSISDNGRGFTERAQDESAGLGLKIMRYRAQMLGGDLMLVPSSSGGVSVRCLLPMPIS